MKKIIITGVANGVGYKTAVKLLSLGHKVFGIDIISESDNINNLKKYGIQYISIDLTDIKVLHKVMEPIVKQNEIDLLINFAGIIETGAMVDVPYEKMLKSMEVNLLVPSELIKIVSKNMNLEGNPMIINMSSVAGYSYRPMWAWYSISKHALEAMSDAYRIELSKYGIKVVVVQPSSIQTELADNSLKGINNEWNINSDYREQLEIVASRQSSKNATPVDEIVNLIEEISNTKNPETRYRVGEWADRIWEDSRQSDRERDQFYIDLLKLNKKD